MDAFGILDKVLKLKIPIWFKVVLLGIFVVWALPTLFSWLAWREAKKIDIIQLPCKGKTKTCFEELGMSMDEIKRLKESVVEALHTIKDIKDKGVTTNSHIDRLTVLLSELNGFLDGIYAGGKK